MENRSEHIPPEQGWGAYATPPSYPSNSVYRGTESSGAESLLGGEQALPTQTSLCFRVREKLQPLLENDDEIRPEMATALYGHLAVCPACSQEFEQIQKIVAMLEAMPPLEIPMDFSRLILHRIQTGDSAIDGAVNAFPTFATSSAVSGEVAAGAEQESVISRRTLSEQRGAVVSQSVTHQKTTTRSTLASGLQSGVQLWQRLILATIVSTVAIFCLTTSWGRQMLGTNVETTRTWLGQIGEMLNRVPVLGWLANFVFTALSDVGEILDATFRELGTLAARGLAVDVALFAAACFFLAARRQRSQIREI